MEIIKKYKTLIIVLAITHVFLNLYGCSMNSKFTNKEQRIQEETLQSFSKAINKDDIDSVDNSLANNAVLIYKLPDGSKEKIENRDEVIRSIKSKINHDSEFTIESIKHENGLIEIEGLEKNYVTKLKGLNQGIRYTCKFSFEYGKICYIVYEENENDNKLLNSSIEGVIGIYLESVNENIVIRECSAGQSAERSGLIQGDIIKSVDGVKVKEMKHGIEEVVYRIRGTAGTKVNLSIERDGKVFNVELQRN